MPERLGTGFAVVCLWLGLAAVQQAVAQPQPESSFSNLPGDGQRNTRLVLTSGQFLKQLKAAGTAELVPKSGAPATPLRGRYEIEAGRLAATFDLQRDLLAKPFQALRLGPSGQWPGAELPLPRKFAISAVIPKDLELLPDDEASVQAEPRIQFHSKEGPPGDSVRTCNFQFLDRVTLASVPLTAVKDPEIELQREGFKVTFQLKRPLEARAGGDAFLELCQGSDVWIYRGQLPEIGPLAEHDLEVLPVPPKGAMADLILRLGVRDAARLARAKVYRGFEGISGLREGEEVSFQLAAGRYEARFAVNCAAGEFALNPLVLVAKDGKGSPHLFRSQGGERICAAERSPNALEQMWTALNGMWAVLLPWLLVVAAFIVLGFIAFIGRHRVWGWLRQSGNSGSAEPQGPSSAPPPPGPAGGLFPNTFPGAWEAGLAQVLQSQLDPLHDTMQEVIDALRQVLNQLQPRWNAAEPGIEKDRLGETPSSYRSLQSGPGASLTDLISRWWAEGADRDRLGGLVHRDPSIKAYRSSNVQDSLRSPTNRTFLFQPSDGAVEWVGRIQEGELFLVPGDPKLFQTGDSLKFLGALFQGLGTSLDNIRFRRVVKACSLRKEPGSTDRYRVIDRGLLELEGRPAAEALTPARALQPTPAAQPVLPKQEIADIVRQAVGQALPGGLQGQIQDLARQVQSLAQSGSRQRSDSPSPDNNVTAVLGAVRKDLSTLGQRMNAIEDLARVVESLRESLARIEGELRNLPAQLPPLALPVAPAPPPAPSNVDTRDLRSEPWLEEIRQEMKDAIPVAVGPGSPQIVAVSDRSGAPEQLWGRLRRWWPPVLNGRIPDGYFAGEPSAVYLWGLDAVKDVLSKAMGNRGWQIEVVHVKVPDNPSAGEQTLQIHKPLSIEDQRVVCACAPASPFTNALLFQFALRVREEQGEDIAVLPAPGLRLTGSTEGYARLAGGKLPDNATSLTEVIQPAILSLSSTADVYTVVLPMQARFR